MDLEELKSEIEENKENPNNKTALRSISMDGVPWYDIEIYKKELEDTPTIEKYNDLFAKINSWKTSVVIKNDARSELMEYWGEIN